MLNRKEHWQAVFLALGLIADYSMTVKEWKGKTLSPPATINMAPSKRLPIVLACNTRSGQSLGEYLFRFVGKEPSSAAPGRTRVQRTK